MELQEGNQEMRPPQPPKPESFSARPDEDPRRFMTTLQIYFMSYKLTDIQKIAQLGSFLKNQAQDWFIRNAATFAQLEDWEHVETEFMNHFGRVTKANPMMLFQRAASARIENEETFQEFESRVTQLFHLAGRDDTETIVMALVNGIQHERPGVWRLIRPNVRTFKTTLDYIQACEEAWATLKGNAPQSNITSNLKQKKGEDNRNSNQRNKGNSTHNFRTYAQVAATPRGAYRNHFQSFHTRQAHQPRYRNSSFGFNRSFGNARGSFQRNNNSPRGNHNSFSRNTTFQNRGRGMQNQRSNFNRTGFKPNNRTQVQFNEAMDDEIPPEEQTINVDQHGNPLCIICDASVGTCEHTQQAYQIDTITYVNPLEEASKREITTGVYITVPIFIQKQLADVKFLMDKDDAELVMSTKLATSLAIDKLLTWDTTSTLRVIHVGDKAYRYSEKASTSISVEFLGKKPTSYRVTIADLPGKLETEAPIFAGYQLLQRLNSDLAFRVSMAINPKPLAHSTPIKSKKNLFIVMSPRQILLPALLYKKLKLIKKSRQ